MPRDRDCWFKFFPNDWRSDEQLALCSLAARGLWMELMSLAHKSGGYVLVNGEVPTLDQLAVQARTTPQAVADGLAELTRYGVCSTAQNGAIVSRRMVKDSERRKRAQENGKKGGNPSLSDSGITHRLTKDDESEVNLALALASGSGYPSSDLSSSEVLPSPPVRMVPTLTPEAKAFLKDHERCFPAPDACERGVCVPSWLGMRWVGQYGGPSQAHRVNAVITAILVETPLGPVGDKPYEWWQERWKARHGSQVQAGAPGKTSQSMANMQRALERRDKQREAKAIPGEVIRAN